jgi:hypothetical protein
MISAVMYDGVAMRMASASKVMFDPPSRPDKEYLFLRSFVFGDTGDRYTSLHFSGKFGRNRSGQGLHSGSEGKHAGPALCFQLFSSARWPFDLALMSPPYFSSSANSFGMRPER